MNRFLGNFALETSNRLEGQMSNQARLHVVFNILFSAMLIVMMFTALFVPWTVSGITYDTQKSFWDAFWYPTLIFAPVIGGIKGGTLAMTWNSSLWRLWLLRFPAILAFLAGGFYLGSHGIETVFGNAASVTLSSALWAFALTAASFFIVVVSMAVAQPSNGPVEVDA